MEVILLLFSFLQQIDITLIKVLLAYSYVKLMAFCMTLNGYDLFFIHYARLNTNVSNHLRIQHKNEAKRSERGTVDHFQHSLVQHQLLFSLLFVYQIYNIVQFSKYDRQTNEKYKRVCQRLITALNERGKRMAVRPLFLSSCTIPAVTLVEKTDMA